MGGKQTKRERRREAFETALQVRTDPEFGIRVEDTPRGGYLVQWRSNPHPTEILMGMTRLRAVLEDLEREVVLALRVADGYSWEEIGWCLEVTGEAVRRRHSAAELEVLAAIDAEGGEGA